MSKKKSKERSSGEESAGQNLPESSEPFFDVGPEIGSSVSTAPGASTTTSSTSGDSGSASGSGAAAVAAATGAESTTDPNILAKRKSVSILEKISVADLWGQYVKCLMMSVPSNVGRADFDNSAGKEAEKYLEEILKLSPSK